MTNVFCVFQEGVYRHTCVGVFESLERAQTAADRVAYSDVDDHHSYDVFAFELNKPDCEAEALYSVHRSAALKKIGPHAGDCATPPTEYRRRASLCSRGTQGCVGDERSAESGES